MYKKIYFLLDASDRKKFIFIVILCYLAIMEVLSIGLIVPFVSLTIQVYTNSIFVKKYLPQTLNLSPRSNTIIFNFFFNNIYYKITFYELFNLY